MASGFDRASIKVRQLLRRLRRQESHTKEATDALAQLAVASTNLMALHFADPSDAPEVTALQAARDKANDLLYRLEHGE